MDKFKLETSIQFPFFKMNELVTYSEVKKPSGVAYILLVLISESKSKTDILANLLENFGVPKTLHYIFAEAIQYLFDQDILEQNFYFNKNDFNSYRIGDFKFTQRGKKIFAEESIPTGVNKDVKIPLFYDIAKNELALNINSDLEPKPLMDSAITPEFMEQFKCNKDVENYLNLQKGKGIPIKREEVITKVEHDEFENWTGKYEYVMNIDGDLVSIKFEDTVLQKFFETYYSNEMVNKSILYKNKFKFKFAYSDKLKLSSYNAARISSILTPKEIDDVLKQKCQLVLTKGNYLTSNGLVIKSSDSIESYDKTVEFIQVDMHDMVFAFVPGLFEFNNSVLGTITIPLVLKIKITQEELKQIVAPYISSISKYSEDNFKSLVQLTNITKDADKAFKIMESYLTGNAENNIVLLNEIKQSALPNAIILSKYKALLQQNYNEYLDNVSEDSLDSALKITASIPRFLNIPSKDILARIFEKIVIKKPVETYQTLVERGFDKSLVVLYVNPVLEALANKNADEKSLIDLINYDAALEVLKTITGIVDYKKPTFNEEEINKQEFKVSYNSAFNLEKNIQVFRNANAELFANYNGFMKIFTTINDDINILEAALKNPNNIKQELIEKKIASGDYQFVFVNLSAKLEIILKNKYGLEGKLSDMLSEARRNGSIDRKIISDLHDFRENRNAYIHPEERLLNFEANDLRRWSKEIFELEVEKK